MSLADNPKVSVSQRWCWIGERDSAYLHQLTDGLAEIRPRMGADATIEVSVVCVESTAKLLKVIAKTRADFFVWSVPESGIAERLLEIDTCRRLHWHSRHIAAGLASPSERQSLMEAGCCWNVEQPHQWASCLAMLCHAREAQGG